MTIKNSYNFGDLFYFKNDPEQLEHILVGVISRPGHTVLELSYCGEVTPAFEIEVTTEPDEMKRINGG